MESKEVHNNKDFYDLKAKAEILFDRIEKSTFYNNEQMYQFEGILRNLLSIAKQEKSNYFEERLKSIQEKFELFRAKKSYKKSEFNRIHSLLNKLNEKDTSNQISSIYYEKKAKKNTDINEDIDKIIPSFDKYLILQFQESIYVVPNVYKKVVKNIDYSVKYLSYNNKKISIFPLSPIQIEYPNLKPEKSNLLILRLLDGYRCIRFDSLIAEETMEENELKERKIETGSNMEDLKYFIVWRGRNCFFLDYTKNSYTDLL
jgi:hypothetical protein